MVDTSPRSIWETLPWDDAMISGLNGGVGVRVMRPHVCRRRSPQPDGHLFGVTLSSDCLRRGHL